MTSINEERFFYGAIGIVLFLMVASWFGLFGGIAALFSPYVNAATSSTVTVTASVSSAISCSTDQTSSAFGTLTSGSISTSTPSASTTMACANNVAGCTLSVNDAGGNDNPGLWNATSSELIESPNAAYDATTTLVAGTEGYGIRATTTSEGTGASLSIATRYNTGLANGLLGDVADVGGLTTTTLTIASTTATTSARSIVITHKAAIDSNTAGGNYDDTITYSCTAN